MNWSSTISGVVSISIGILILLEIISKNYPKEEYLWNIFWSLFFMVIGILIIAYSDKADKIERIRRKK